MNEGSFGDVLLTIREAAQRLAISVRTYYRLVQREGAPVPVKIGGSARVSAQELAEFIEQRKRGRRR